MQISYPVGQVAASDVVHLHALLLGMQFLSGYPYMWAVGGESDAGDVVVNSQVQQKFHQSRGLAFHFAAPPFIHNLWPPPK